MTNQSLLFLFASVASFLFALGKMYLADKNEVHTRLNAHSERLVTLEQKVEHAPTHQDLKDVNRQLHELAQTQGRILGILEGMRDVNQWVIPQVMGGKTA